MKKMILQKNHFVIFLWGSQFKSFILTKINHYNHFVYSEAVLPKNDRIRAVINVYFTV